MSRVFVVVACLVAFSAFNQQKLSVVAGIITDHIDTSKIEFEGDYSAHGSKKHSSGAELTSLAHSGAVQANTAVRNQQSAGLQAALGAQTGYARAAIEAASTAQVALIAKQVIVQNLQRQLEDAESNLEAEEAQYQQQLRAAAASQNAAQQTQQQLTAATAALAAVQQSTQQAERAAAQSAQAAGTQHDMVEEAKRRVARISERLNNALAGLHLTQESAKKAKTAAQVAQSNAEASAQLAVVNSASNQIEDHDALSAGFHH